MSLNSSRYGRRSTDKHATEIEQLQAEIRKLKREVDTMRLMGRYEQDAPSIVHELVHAREYIKDLLERLNESRN